MKRKFIYLTTIFVVLFVSSVIIISHHYERNYKIDAWESEKYFEVTEFNVKPDDDLSLNMFDNDFEVNVTIKGIAENDLFERFIAYVHKSEHFEYIDGEKVAIIKFTPVMSYKMFGKTDYEAHTHTEKFKYKLNVYNYDFKKYIFRCGNFEEIISFHSGK